ncbi:hypothetical protein CGMCC3_g4800 [Colletotrichum fructicola]|nr:uncharacterized protein CGMCC3_g4800 [Colletotrichum fructicola]KAE9579277.1 hypothetical protein CGMCC3_g4800 [Colletotrichum fructicola]
MTPNPSPPVALLQARPSGRQLSSAGGEIEGDACVSGAYTNTHKEADQSVIFPTRLDVRSDKATWVGVTCGLGAVSIECPAPEQSRSAAFRRTIESANFHFLLHHVIDSMAMDFISA